MKFLKNRTVLGIFCIVIALVICFVVTPLFNASASKLTTIVRVKSDLKLGQLITDKEIETVEVGAYNLPANVITKSADVVGKYVATPMVKDEYVLSTKISTEPASENIYLYGLTGEKRVMSVTIPSFATGLSGKLISGDIVSIIACDYQEKGETVVPDELQYVQVVAATDKKGNDEAKTDYRADGEEETSLPATVTLLVSPSQALVLADLEAEGEIHIALVYRGIEENAKQFLEAQEKILQDKQDVVVHEPIAEESKPAEETVPDVMTIASETESADDAPDAEIAEDVSQTEQQLIIPSFFAPSETTAAESSEVAVVEPEAEVTVPEVSENGVI